MRTRKFNGKKYEYVNEFISRPERLIKNLQKSGWSVRTTKTHKKHVCVWMCPKTKRTKELVEERLKALKKGGRR